MPPKRKASASKGSDTKKNKRESPPAKDKVTTAETAEVWFSVEHWYDDNANMMDWAVL